MFVAGPPVVNRLSPRQFDKQDLGGWEIQLRAGAIDEAADTEDEAFALARRFLSYLPSSVYDAPSRGPITDAADRREESLFDAIPRDIRKVYRVRPIIEKIVDGKMRVFYKDEAGVLVEQAFAKDDSKSVSQVLAEKGLKARAFTLWILGT